MNYLVHLYLSDPDPEVRLGNLLGDWVKGRLDPQAWPAGVLRGLRQHRQVDRLTQTAPAVQRSKARIAARFGLLRPILIDVFYDHLLAAHWTEFHPQPLAEFAADIYRLLDRHAALLPAAFRPVARRMADHNWLLGYRDPKCVPRVLQSLAERLRRPTILATGAAELARDRDGFYADLQTFLPAARNALQASTGPDHIPKP